VPKLSVQVEDARGIRTCHCCEAVKPLNLFVREKSYTSGYGQPCLQCKAEKQRLRSSNNPERAKEIRQQYANRHGGLGPSKEYMASYRAKFPERRRAGRLVNKAIKRGDLVRPGRCQKCGVGCYPDASHHDYARPLDVEWLCKSCHFIKDHKLRQAGVL
jgi:hypothetical protein